MTDQLEFKPGGFYRCRNGCKAEVFATDMSMQWPIVGRVWKDGLCFTCLWNETGKHHDEKLDLLSEWREERLKWEVKYCTGGGNTYETLLEAEKRRDEFLGSVAIFCYDLNNLSAGAKCVWLRDKQEHQP
jgi:hypothetical protein